jgi:hypothetical protein
MKQEQSLLYCIRAFVQISIGMCCAILFSLLRSFVDSKITDRQNVNILIVDTKK